MTRCWYCLKVNEVTVEYTDCQPDIAQLRFRYSTCAEYIDLHIGHRCFCNVEFQLTNAFVVSLNRYSTSLAVTDRFLWRCSKVLVQQQM